MLTLAAGVDAATSGVLTDYGRFKHGGEQAIDAYAAALAEHIASGPADGPLLADAPATVTSPPFAAIPSASHYLAEALCGLLVRGGRWRHHAFVPLRKRATGEVTDYARLDRSARERSQERLASLVTGLPDGFDRPHVIVVNDVRVTGQQERLLERYLRSHTGATTLSWIYLAELSEELAAADPATEHRLNTIGTATDEELIAFLAAGAWRPTARLVRRMLTTDPRVMREGLGHLAHDRVREVARLAEAEGLCTALDVMARAGRAD